MDERARIPVGLPVDNPTESYWQDPPDEIADLRTTEALPATADVVVIGSGITGAAVAWGLLQADTPPDIVMLEARQACSGATGRNGGHTKAASYRSFLDNEAALGTAAAAQVARLELANIRAVHAFARRHAIACDARACDTVDVVYDAAQWAQARAAVAAMRAAMPGDDAAAYTLHDAAAARALFLCAGPDPVRGAVQYPAGSLSAYRFGVGVLGLCLARGLNLQTRTPALALAPVDGGGGVGEYGRARWAVDTPRGRILAERVVLATNGYTAALVPRLQGVVVPLRGQIAAHRPGSRMPPAGLEVTYSFIYEGGYEYMVPRPPGTRFAGDIVMGGGLVRAPDEGLGEYGTTDDAVLNETIRTYLRETTPRYFGDNWGDDDPAGRIRKEWTGIMGYSPDGFPLIGEMPGDRNLWLACSFQGHGMVLCWMCARALTQMMTGKDDAELSGWFPAAFRVTEERLQRRFQGRLHTSATSANAE